MCNQEEENVQHYQEEWVSHLHTIQFAPLWIAYSPPHCLWNIFIMQLLHLSKDLWMSIVEAGSEVSWPLLNQPYGGFLKYGCAQIINFNGISLINHPFWGSPILGNQAYVLFGVILIHNHTCHTAGYCISQYPMRFPCQW